MFKPQFFIRTTPSLLLVLLSILSVVPYVYSLRRLAPRVAQDDECPVILDPQQPTSTSRIIGGDPAGLELASSLAYILNSAGYYTTGILVSPNHVVFVASTGVGIDDEVIIGEQVITSTSGGISISSIVPHPSFAETNSGSLFNLAYLTLSRPASGTPVKVNTNLDFPQSEAVVRLVGYGRTVPSETTQTTELNQVDVPLYDFSQCLNDLELPRDWSSYRVFCAGYEDSGCSVCFGDGPVIQYSSDDEPVLVGMWNTGVSCSNESTSPASYSRVAALADFLPDGVERTDDVRQIGLDSSDLNGEGPGASSPNPGNTNGSEFPFGAVIGGVVAGIVVIIVLIVICICCARRKRKIPESKPTSTTQAPGVIPGSTDSFQEHVYAGSDQGGLQMTTSDPKPLPLPQDLAPSPPESGADGAFEQPNSAGYTYDYNSSPVSSQVPPSNMGMPPPPASGSQEPLSQDYYTPHSNVAPAAPPTSQQYDPYYGQQYEQQQYNQQPYNQQQGEYPPPPANYGPNDNVSPPESSAGPSSGGGASVPYAFQMYDPYETSRTPQSPLAPDPNVDGGPNQAPPPPPPPPPPPATPPSGPRA